MAPTNLSKNNHAKYGRDVRRMNHTYHEWPRLSQEIHILSSLAYRKKRTLLVFLQILRHPRRKPCIT